MSLLSSSFSTSAYSLSLAFKKPTLLLHCHFSCGRHTSTCQGCFVSQIQMRTHTSLDAAYKSEGSTNCRYALSQISRWEIYTQRGSWAISWVRAGVSWIFFLIQLITWVRTCRQTQNCCQCLYCLEECKGRHKCALRFSFSFASFVEHLQQAILVPWGGQLLYSATAPRYSVCFLKFAVVELCGTTTT